MRPLAAGAVLAAALVGAVACGPARRGAVFNRPVQLTEQEAQGERLYMRQCNQCHPGGAGGLGPALNNKPLPGFAMKKQIRLGAGTMPAFPEDVLSDAEVDAIVAYVNKLQRE